jgi:hypothetical protein
MDYEEEENKGFKIKVTAPPQNNKSNNNYKSDEYIDDDIEEEIESQRDDKNTLGESSGRGFGITVS